MLEIFERFMTVYISETGAIKEQTDTEFLVTGNDNSNVLRIVIPRTLNISSVSVSFIRADGFTISNYQLSVNSTLSSNESVVFDYTFKKDDRVLAIPGELQMSFLLKSKTFINAAQVEQTIATVITTANVKRSIASRDDMTLAEELYEASLLAVDGVNADLVNHKLDFNNPHKVSAEQVPIKDSEYTVHEKLINIEEKINTNTENINSIQNDVTNNFTQGNQKLQEHIDDKSNPHDTTGSNAKIERESNQSIKDYVDNGLSVTLDEAKRYTNLHATKNNQIGFVYNTIEIFKNSVKLVSTGTEENGKTELESITTENGETYTKDVLVLGSTNIYIRQKGVPDYWLSRFSVNYITDDKLEFFIPFEGEGNVNVDLANYVTFQSYPTNENAGVVKVSTENGLKVDNNGQLSINPATDEEIEQASSNKPITAKNLPRADLNKYGIVKAGKGLSVTEGALNVLIDDATSDTSLNPVQNKVITSYINSQVELLNENIKTLSDKVQVLETNYNDTFVDINTMKFGTEV